MNTTKKICRSLSLVLTTAVLLSACGNLPNQSSEKVSEQKSGNQEESNQIQGYIDFPKEYKNVIDNVAFDTVLEIPEELDYAELKRSSALAQKPNKEKMHNVLFSDKEIKKIEVEDTNTDESGEQYDLFVASYTDGSQILIGRGLDYRTSFFERISVAFRLEGQEEPTSNYFSKEKTLPFADPKTAFSEIKQTIQDLGYQVSEYDHCYYALDHQTLSEQKPSKEDTEIVAEKRKNNPNYKESEKIQYDEKDDSYYFLAKQIHQGLPVYFGTSIFPLPEEDLHPIQAVYAKDGIAFLQLGNVAPLYQFQSSEEVIALIEFEKIAIKMAEKYNNILTNAHYEVKKATLYQIPVKNHKGEYDVKIGWFVEIEESGIDPQTKQGYTYSLYTLMDAETGEEIFL